MRNLLPELIIEGFSKGRRRGRFNGLGISVDIKGFTSLTEVLVKKGNYGVEVLSDIINTLFGRSVEIVASHKGQITSFEGDAFTAVFKGDDLKAVGECAAEISAHLNDNSTISTDIGDFAIQYRIGIGSGDVLWEILEGGAKLSYLVKGSAIKNAVMAQGKARSGKINIIENVDFVRGNRLYRPPKTRNSSSIIKKFVHDKVYKMKISGEFRHVTSIFLSIPDLKVSKLSALLLGIVATCAKYDGYLNKISYGDKGCIALIVFGAPRSFPDDIQRAFKFCIELQKRFPLLRGGISSGMAFAGFVGGISGCEYSVLGEVVNISARLAFQAKPGEYYTCEQTLHKVPGTFKFSKIGKILLKGSVDKIAMHKLEGTASHSEELFAGKFVGREKEFKKLHLTFKDAVTLGKREQCTIYGIAGIGKSRLAWEVEKLLKHDGIRAWYSSCDKMSREGFYSVKSLLLEIFGDPQREFSQKVFKDKYKIFKKEYGDLGEYKEILEGFLGVNRDSLFFQISPSDRYTAIERTLNKVFSIISAKKNSFILFEDIQWMEEESRKILESVFSTSEIALPILATFRTDESQQKCKGFKQYIQHAFDLNKLSLNSSEEFLESILNNEVSKALVRLIFDKSEGNPFFLEQIALYLQEEGKIYEKGGKLFSKKGENVLSGRLSGILAARIDKLQEEIREVCKTASVLGLEFSINVLSAMLKKKDINAVIKTGEGESLWSPISEMIYIFKHGILRDAIYGMQLKKTLKELHRLAAEALIKVYENSIYEKAKIIAYHFRQAAEKKEYIKYLSMYAIYARQHYLNNEAIKSYKALLNCNIEPKQRVVFKSRMAVVYQGMGNYKRALQIEKKNFLIAQKLGYDEFMGHCKGHTGELYWNLGDYAKSMEVFQEAMAIYTRIGHYGGLSSIYIGIGNNFLYQGDAKNAIPYYRKATVIANKHGVAITAMKAYGNMALAFKNMGQIKKSIQYHNIRLKKALEMNEPIEAELSRANLALIEMERGLYRQALKKTEVWNEYSLKIGRMRFYLTSLISLGHINIALGNIGIAEKYYTKFIKKVTTFGQKRTRLWGLHFRASLDLTKNDLSETRILLKKLCSESLTAADSSGCSQALNLQAQLELREGNYTAALHLLEESGEIQQQIGELTQFAGSKITLGRVYQGLGRRKEALSTLRKAHSLLKKYGMYIAHATAAHHLCMMLFDDGKSEGAAKYLSELKYFKGLLKLEQSDFYYYMNKFRTLLVSDAKVPRAELLKYAGRFKNKTYIGEFYYYYACEYPTGKNLSEAIIKLDEAYAERTDISTLNKKNRLLDLQSK
ncbi:tetratricopeptide repeat protein [bacterium]|nr:tetratricopeptide repeat protein [bacterium]